MPRSVERRPDCWLPVSQVVRVSRPDLTGRTAANSANPLLIRKTRPDHQAGFHIQEDENLGAMAVDFTAEELRELNDATSRIVVQGDRLREGLLEMSGREAPIRN